ncbi:hypothetical protein HYY70_05410 [Candidatus Woesearchaeota archaeon]|nr:hypothetical protein [Candidatus Woesearchaeota archaeon]
MEPEIEFLDLSPEEKILLLDVLDFSIDKEGYIYDELLKERHICPYTKKEVLFQNASILPGSTLVINTSALTISEYITDKLEKKY